jgi:hypothetical protein
VTALKDEAVRVSQGVGRAGKRPCRPLAARILLRNLEMASSVSRVLETNGDPRIDVTYVGPGRNGTGLLKSLLGRGGYRAVCFLGLSGALSPFFVPGDVVAGMSVRSPDSPELAVPNSPFFSPFVRSGVFLSVDRLIFLPDEKRFLGLSEGADTVDMESYSWIECAEQSGMRALLLRVVSDGIREALPPEILTFVTPSGENSGKSILKAILIRPSILSELWRLRRSIHLARTRLSDVGGLLWDCVEQERSGKGRF